MQINKVEQITSGELISKVSQTRLKGYGQPFIYENSSIELVKAVDTDKLVPAQRYVLMPGVRTIANLRENLLTKDIDIFELDGALRVWLRQDMEEAIPVLPPIVEESVEPNGETVWLINDGMHRVYAARLANKPINIILIKNVPTEYPYYAYALEKGWDDVTELEELPDQFEKKAYRQPENYKDLFRNFNEIFPGVQKKRKDSNPDYLKKSA